ncbi:MAG: UDP-N-acetylmuramate dehydrogenase [Elusimicrobia bacterium]|nr:UDP-N-acetylmuramate dehydrogenase [Elusimicrobiota bacterium]
MPSPYAEELRFLFPALKTDEPLSRHTSWGIGGPADYYLEIHSSEELAKLFVWARAHGLPLTPLGLGSNLLVSDKGIRGVTFRLRGDFEALRFEGDRAVAGAGVLLPQISRAAAERGLTGAEPFCGIPGTVGGALQTNAGTPEGDIGRLVREVRGMDVDGRVRRWGRDDIQFVYRGSSLGGQTVISVDLQLRTGKKNDILASMDQQLKRRAERQPLGTKNCGSVFKNPPGEYAARLIEAVGLKGFRVGGARVSLKHANFIENVDHATAADVQTLLDALRSAVRHRFGIELELEVWTVGEL